METRISVKPGKGVESMAGKVAEAIRAESLELLPHFEGITVALGEEPVPDGRSSKSIRVRVDFRRGGHYLVEARGEDWAGLIPEAAQKVSRGAERALHNRWELAP